VAERKSAVRIFRFGVFEIDEETGELRKDGKAQPRLREQALRILLMLLQRPRELVAREELRERLWSADTFVDFDHGVNTAINQLRSALGDDAANPRFIQTLPRRGYRFIAPVEIASGTEQPADPAMAANGERRRTATENSEPGDRTAVVTGLSLLSDARDLPAVSNKVTRTLFVLIQLIYLTFYVLSLARLTEVNAILTNAGEPTRAILVALIVTAAAGIPTRLYLITAAAFNYRGLGRNFRRLFPVLLPLDEVWALAPFLAIEQIGIGLALAVTAALLYLPFAQRSLLLMGERTAADG
jgi:cholera toxin transcriptional activator